MNWRRFFHREAADAEQRAELELYLDLTTQELIDRGMAPAAARAAARRKLGNPTQILEEVYRMNTLTFLESALRDARQALRMIRTRPGFSASVLLSLALGIGANTAIFSVVNSVLIRPLPYPEPDALASVANIFVIQGRRFDNVQLSPGMFATARENSRVFEKFGVWTAGAATVSGLGNPEQIVTVTATQGVLPTLGIPAALGRWFSLEDDSPGTPETVILSHGYWQRKFGGAPDVLSRTLTIDFIPRQVIGVMPPDFRFLDRSPDVLLPERFPTTGLKVDSFGYNGIARLKPDTTFASANQDIARVWAAWAEAERLTKTFQELAIQPNLHPLKQDVVGDIGTALTVVMAALGLVLLLVCANVANLVLVRAEARRQEFAIRAALGAGWGRIARELLVESLTLGAGGGALGLLLAYFGLQLFVKLGPGTLPRLKEISLDAPAVAYVLVCSLALSLLFGLAAVLKLGHPGRLRNARGATQSAGQRRAQSGLVIVQVALALVLLVASGLLIRTFLALQAVQPGFTHPEQIQTVRLSIPEALIPEPDQVIRQQAALVEKLAAIPGVTAVGFASGLPMEAEYSNGMLIAAEGITPTDHVPPNRIVRRLSPGLLAAQGTRIVVGRDFTWDDVFGQRLVATVSENMARETWGGSGNALGKRIRVGGVGPWREVVGVVENVHMDGVDRPAPTMVYLRVGVDPPTRPGRQPSVPRGATFAIRSERASTQGFLQEVTAAVKAINPDLPLAKIRTLHEVYRLSTARTSFALVLLGIAGSMALILAIIGLYGVLAYAVAQRKQEISIRLALGAEPGSIQALFVRQGLALAGIGGIIGLASAAALSRGLASLLYGVSPLDPLTFIAALALLTTAAATASYLPARQAACVDPMDNLRSD